MTNEIGKKRSVIVLGSDSGKLREGDDIPEKDVDAPLGQAHVPAPVTLEAMARYLREITTAPTNAKGNAYSTDETLSIVKTHNTDGTPAALVTPSDSAASVFASSTDKDVIMSIAGQMFDKDTIEKLRDPKTGLHEVLRTIIPSSPGRNPASTTPDNAPEIQKKISGILQKNRFNPTPGKSPFLGLATAASEIDSRPIGVGQGQLGVYDAKPATEATEVTYEKMKRVGLALMLRATGEFIDGNPEDAGVNIGAIIPGSAQLLGAKVIDRKSMWASDLSTEQGRPPNIGIREKASSLDLTLDGNGAESYGSLNSYVEPFAGFAPLGMLTLGAALIIALRLLSEGFELIFSAISPPSVLGTDPTIPKPEGSIRLMGSSNNQSLSQSESAFAFFGFITTQHNYSETFDRGVDVFFGFNGIDDIVKGGKRLLESPGYYVVMIREIIRSGAKIVESIADAFSSGPLEAVQGLLGLVDVIRSSKIVGYFNMVTRLGDIILKLEDEGIITEFSMGAAAEPGNLPDGGKISTIDRMIDNAASHIMKNRIRPNDPTLAWRTASTPSAYLLPAVVLNASDYLPESSKIELTTFTDVPKDIRYSVVSSPESPRLDAEIVQKIEAELDSEYVPFYFHDLRTNEIVSFHAFLEACTDAFNVSYDSGNYMGRVEGVHVYNRTERTINLTFKVVATNYNDFDVMWWKINKLITMLYPQWSKGRKVIETAGQNEFIQPFSQTISSSPVIRLRLGDVLKSNYSKFSLARLFGLGSNDFIVDGNKTDPARIKKMVEFQKKAAEIKEAILTKPITTEQLDRYGYKKDYKAWLMPGGEPMFVKDLNSLVGPPVPAALSSTAPLKQIDKKMKITVTKVNAVQTSKKHIEPLYYVTLDEPGENIDPGPYAVSFHQLQPDDKDIGQQVVKSGVSQPEEIDAAKLKAVDEFFSSENAIVKSFESTTGRGLAGVIKSMTFDWVKPTWDTSGLGNRAPQWAEIALVFQPIHDIAPGIDSNGFNRAPVYNVGSIVNNVAGTNAADQKSNDIFDNNHSAINKIRRKS